MLNSPQLHKLNEIFQHASDADILNELAKGGPDLIQTALAALDLPRYESFKRLKTEMTVLAIAEANQKRVELMAADRERAIRERRTATLAMWIALLALIANIITTIIAAVK